MARGDSPANVDTRGAYCDEHGHCMVDMKALQAMVDGADHRSPVHVHTELERNYVREYCRSVGKKLDVDVK